MPRALAVTSGLAALAAVALTAHAARAQVLPRPDPLASMRLDNELRWIEGRQRALEAQAMRVQTDRTVRRLEQQRAPDPLARRQAEIDAVEADQRLRAGQAASTERARELRRQGYAADLPIAPPR